MPIRFGFRFKPARAPAADEAESASGDCEEHPAVQVAITCRHGNLRDELQTQIRTKAEKLLTYFERVTQIQVTVDFGKDGVDVEILVDAEHRHDFVGRDHKTDVMQAFDAAFHRVEHQIKRYKEKVQDHRRDVAMGNLAGNGDGDVDETAGDDSGTGEE